MYDLYLLPTKAVDYKLLTNIKKEDLLGWFLTYQNFRLCLSLTDFSPIFFTEFFFGKIQLIFNTEK